MSATTDPVDAVPPFELKHRLARAMEYAQLSVESMAAELGRSETTIRNYLSGRTVPDRATRAFWARRCGVSEDWLEQAIGCIGWFAPLAA